jgi:glycosyltransferase involved in cell wall biosynthesis
MGLRRGRRSESAAGYRPRITMLLENDLYPQDVRVRYEARSLVSAGYRVHVIAPRGDGQARREHVEDVEVERFWLPMEHRGRVRDLLWEYCVAHVQLYLRGARAVLAGSDVLHLHNPPDTLFPPALLGRLVGCRLVFDQHDLFPDLFEAKFGRTPVLAVVRAAQRASLRLADVVLVTNESQREAALEEMTNGRPVIVVRNGLRKAQLAPGAPPRPGPLDDPALVYVGALESQDGVEHIPELLQALINDHGLTGTRLVVVGFGAERAPLERRIEQLGLADRVTFTGRTEHQRVLEIIAAADICIDTAECAELNHRTTMVKIVEYLSFGRPTVAFALRETQRTVGDAAALAECGDWGQFAALVASLARSDTLRHELGARARDRAEALVWEHSEESLLDAYGRLLPGPRARSAS